MPLLGKSLLDLDKTYELLKGLLGDESFRYRLELLQSRNKALKKYYSTFIDGITSILSDMEVGREFKGKCEGCP